MDTMENLDLQSVIQAYKEWLTHFSKVKIHKICRESNQAADWLAIEASDHQIFQNIRNEFPRELQNLCTVGTLGATTSRCIKCIKTM